MHLKNPMVSNFRYYFESKFNASVFLRVTKHVLFHEKERDTKEILTSNYDADFCPEER